MSSQVHQIFPRVQLLAFLDIIAMDVTKVRRGRPVRVVMGHGPGPSAAGAVFGVGRAGVGVSCLSVGAVGVCAALVIRARRRGPRFMGGRRVLNRRARFRGVLHVHLLDGVVGGAVVGVGVFLGMLRPLVGGQPHLPVDFLVRRDGRHSFALGGG